MRPTLLIGLLICSFAACKKDKLKDDKSVFIGKWEWVYTNHIYGWCDNMEMEETLTPLTENMTFTLEFLQKGIVYFYANGELKGKHRLKFQLFEVNRVHCGLSNAAKFGIDLDNKKESIFDGCVNQDTIYLINFDGFLFQTEPGCESYANYFVRE